MKSLFLGDVVGRAGRDVVVENVPALRERLSLDLVVVNGENAAGGFGITAEICKAFYAAGVDIVTGGNHSWDQQQVIGYIDSDTRLLRPFNIAPDAPGRGAQIYTLAGRKVMVIGHVKGEDTPGRLKHNFGMARPEGYRKAIRLMELANRFGLPVITLVDTPGAYPGKGAEERGQSEAIARSTEKCLDLGVPLISVVIGEGGSGGAVAFATASRVVMLEHSIYSVISPEGCASILWKDGGKMREAAEALRLTAQNLIELGVCDHIIPEPAGGAHRDKDAAIASVGSAIQAMLSEIDGQSAVQIRNDRRTKYLALGSKGLAA